MLRTRSIFVVILCIWTSFQAGIAEDAPVAGAAADGPDLSLQEAVDRALAHNLGLMISRYQPANAIDDVVIEESAFDFQLFGSTSTSESRSAARTSALDDAPTPQSENRRARVGTDKLFSTGATVTLDSSINRSASNNNAARNPDYSSDVGLSLRQPLLRDAWARVNLAPLARARAGAEQSVFQLRSDALDVILETEIAYWNLAFARANYALVASSIELAETLLEENRERERLGLVTPLEVLQAETELTNQQEDLIQAERAIEDAEDNLRRLMGGTSFQSPVEDELEVHPLPLSLPEPRPLEEVVRDSVTRDTDAEAQELAIEVQRINRMLAEDDTRPNLDLVGGLSYSGRDTDGEDAFRGATEAAGSNWNVGVEMRFPWGFRESRARLRQAERNLEREKVRLYDIKQDQALAARTAWRAVRAGKKRIEVTEKSLLLNTENFEQERARFNSGVIAYRAVLEAQRDLDAARSNRLAAIIESLRASSRLSRIDGTILERNGFSWGQLDRLADAPDLQEHPLIEELDGEE